MLAVGIICSRSVRIFLLLLGLIVGLSTATRSLAQAPDPGAQQDAEAAREKLLKASDELDNIQANSESTKTSVDAMKTDVTALQANVTQLQTENAAIGLRSIQDRAGASPADAH
jgi:septal ring factor EnvC (AmiA/AmiB activator)